MGRLSREELKILSTKGEDMAKAVGLFDDVSARDLEFLRKRTEERAHWDRISMQAEARREGHAKGMEKGMEKRSRTVTLNMLKSGFEIPVIAKMTGLSIEEIKNLKDGSN